MRHLTMLLVSSTLVSSLLAGCSSNPTTAPSNGGGGTPPGGMPPTGGGGTSQQPGGGSPPPATAAVTVGDIFFKSGLNGSSNPAVDTVAVNGTVTWTWATTETLPHSVQSVGSPSFTSSAIMAGSGSSHQVTFTTPGSYQYDCAVHGQMMTGTIVVMAAAASPSMKPQPM
jgi:copper binding plastocyanin/azurin family protein